MKLKSYAVIEKSKKLRHFFFSKTLFRKTVQEISTALRDVECVKTITSYIGIYFNNYGRSRRRHKI